MKNKASSSAYLIVLATLTAVLLAGCGGGDGGGDGGSTPRDVCEGLSLAQTTAMPGTLVTLAGVTDVDADTFLEITGPLSSIDGGIGRFANGDFFFAAPLHPDLAGDAGSVDVSLNVSGKRCELGTLALDALPPASEDAADIALASIETLALQQNQSFGFDPSSFDRNTTTSPTEIMQAQLYFALLDPDSPTSIDKQREQLAALTAEERIFIGRFFEGIGLQQLINEQITFFQGVTVTIEDTPTPLASALLGPVSRAKLSPLAQVQSADSAAGSCTALFTGGVSRITILGAAELSMALKVSEMARDELARTAGSQTTKSILLTGVGMLGLPGQTIAMAGNAILMVRNAGNQDLAFLLPSTISDIRMRLNVPGPINEDYMDVPGQQLPRWLAFATATSKGFNLQKRVLNAAFLGTGIISMSTSTSVAVASTQFAADSAFPDDPSDSSCYSIPPFTWPNIAVTERQWLKQDPIVTGSAVTLSDPNLVTPAQTGTSNIFIDLDSAKFPCAGCILIADLDVEIAKKNVVFSRVRYRADSEIAPVTVTGSIQNSSVPDLSDISVTDGGVITSIDRNGVGFSIVVQGVNDRALFPLTVTLESTSTNLPPDTDNRQATTEIVLDAVVNITRLDQGCIAPGSDVQLSAEVSGVAAGDDLVIWSTLDAIQITDAGRNQIIASAANPGSYTITATSTTTFAEDSFVVVVGRCDVELSVYTYTEVSIDSSNESAQCGAGSKPPLLKRTQETGAVPTTNALRHADNFTSGGSVSMNLSLQELLISTFREPTDDSCKTMTVNEASSAVGTISSQPDSAILDINLDLAISGGCETNIISTDSQICKIGGAAVRVIASFVIEVNAKSAGTYVAEMNLSCSLNQPPGALATLPNIFVVPVAFDQNGQLIADPQQYMDLRSVSNLGSMPTQCYDNTPTTQSVQQEFTLLPPPPGETYTMLVRYSLFPQPWPLGIFDPNFSGGIDRTGSMRGTISVRAK